VTEANLAAFIDQFIKDAHRWPDMWQGVCRELETLTDHERKLHNTAAIADNTAEIRQTANEALTIAKRAERDANSCRAKSAFWLGIIGTALGIIVGIVELIKTWNGK
jgi:hypothetical protein